MNTLDRIIIYYYIILDIWFNKIDDIEDDIEKNIKVT